MYIIWIKRILGWIVINLLTPVLKFKKNYDKFFMILKEEIKLVVIVILYTNNFYHFYGEINERASEGKKNFTVRKNSFQIFMP